MGVTFAPQADPLTPAKAAEQMGEETVTMVFPHPVMLTRDDHQRILFPAGTHQVPASLSTHKYLKDSGVEKYDPAKEKKPAVVAPIVKLSPAHAEYLVNKGYSDAKDLKWAQEFFNKLTPEQQNGMLIDFATDPANLAKMQPLPPPPPTSEKPKE